MSAIRIHGFGVVIHIVGGIGNGQLRTIADAAEIFDEYGFPIVSLDFNGGLRVTALVKKSVESIEKGLEALDVAIAAKGIRVRDFQSIER